MFPASAPPTFLRDLEIIETLAAQPATSPEHFAGTLNSIYLRVANAKFSDYDLLAIRQAAPELIYRLFDLRLGLRERIASLEAGGMMTDEVAAGLRNCFRILRYATDMLGEISIGNARYKAGDEPLTPFRGREGNTLTNYTFYKNRQVAFKAGDVILERGHAHNSAAIARAGDVDSQFSHIGVVHIDDDGNHWIVESLIEDGAIINPLEKSLAHGVVRAALYRHKDEVVAARAAKAIFDYVLPTRKSFARRILYDFTMRLDDRKPLFCSKLVRLAFLMASEGNINLPAYPTRFSMKNTDFLTRIGVKARETFAPADIDLESSFDLVAEWQDYRETPNVRLQDFTMDQVFLWMDQYNLKFRETVAVRIVSWFGRFASYLSDDAKIMLQSLFPRVPRNMRAKTVATVAMLHKTAEPLYHELQRLDLACVAANGRPLHGLEVVNALERMRSKAGGTVGYLSSR